MSATVTAITDASAFATAAKGVFTDTEKGRIHGLLETVVELAQYAEQVKYRPADSREFHAATIGWSFEFEAMFWKGVADGTIDEDEWRENIEDFAAIKLAEVADDCLAP